MSAPNPGSKEALEQGCTCPANILWVGEYSEELVPNYFHYISCPLHGKEAKSGKD